MTGAASTFPPAGPPVPSPCTGVCRIDDASGWCAGCLRSLDEIAGWASASEAERRAIWRAIGLRDAARGSSTRR